MLFKEPLHDLLGKTIQSIIIVKDNPWQPREQIFVLFDDSTYFEFYGECIGMAGHLDKGGKTDVLHYTRDTSGIVSIYEKAKEFETLTK